MEPKENLKITLVQPDIIWEDKTANFNGYEKLLVDLYTTDLIVFPEMFNTGFTMASEEFKELMDGQSVQWMRKLAVEKNAAVVGSLIIEEEGKIFNRAVWIFPDGKAVFYDKRHLFTMGQEHLHYSQGEKKIIVEYRGWKLCPLICYDLRFPVWSRNTENFDVLIYMANWPAPRHSVWKNLLVARAIENQSYCVGVTRSGIDGEGIKYCGESAIINPKGLAEFMGEKEEIRTFEVSYSELHNFRKSFPVLNDGDEFELK